MGNCVDREVAQSRQGTDLETEAAWQAHYIKWADIFGIPNPCGSYPEYQQIVVIYIKYVQCGINYNNKQELCWAKVQGYAKAIKHFSNSKILLCQQI